MMTMNNGIYTGRFTKDPELKTTTKGTQYVKFDLAVKSGLKDENGEYKTIFIPFVAWQKRAETIASYCKKGDMLLVTGSLESRQYETQEGEKRTIWEVLVDGFEFMGGSKKKTANEPELEEIENENLPF